MYIVKACKKWPLVLLYIGENFCLHFTYCTYDISTLSRQERTNEVICIRKVIVLMFYTYSFTKKKKRQIYLQLFQLFLGFPFSRK
jgi:hypothetical protein